MRIERTEHVYLGTLGKVLWLSVAGVYTVLLDFRFGMLGCDDVMM